MSLILGVDLGTQSLKVLIYCMQQRKVLASASAPLIMVTCSNGSAEQQADHWLSALHIAMHQLDPALRQQLAAYHQVMH
jgi:xylulokinase